ncbi:hypothetical protein [Halopseudomonas pelagia]|uniref:hypothetical protein n=1 Tax=Halopseudomonas pelagia TaxID=553151 RepID=UPI0030D9DC4F|tara:strand:+ start:12 stop:680 length:669 start_codon:yes stop_codon:yes gene_type:complete
MTALSYLLLSVAAAGLCYWLWQRKPRLHAEAQGALKASLVALLLTASSALLLGLANWGASHASVEHAQRIIGLAAQHMSLPLLGLACLLLGRGLRWKPVIWSQIILGLLAFYELSRYLEWQAGYQWLVNLIGAACLALIAFLYRRQDLRVSVLCLIGLVSLLTPALINSTLPLASLLNSSLQASWLLPGFVACALAVGLLAEQAHNSQTDSHRSGPKAASDS